MDPKVVDSVTNANFKNLAEAGAFYASLTMKNAVEANEALSQLARSSIEQHQQSLVGLGQLRAQMLATHQMAANTAAAKATEDLAAMDPKGAVAEGSMSFPISARSADLGAAVANLQAGLASVRTDLASLLEILRSVKPAS